MTPAQRFDKKIREVVQATRSPVPEAKRLDRLLREFRALHATPSLLHRIAEWFAGSWRVPAPAMAFMAMVLVVQGVALVALKPQEAAETETYRGANAPCVDGPRIRAMFRPDAAHAEVLILLRKVEASIVAGPSETGELWLKIPKGRSVDEALNLLKSSALIDEAIVVEQTGKGCTP
jgi:hypothetical protein